MTAPQQVPLDTALYMETLEDELSVAASRARVYRTQVKQLEQLLQRYRDRFGDLDQAEQAVAHGGELDA